MHPIFYLAAWIPGILAINGLFAGGVWAWATPLFMFGAVPVADALWSGRRRVRDVSDADRLVTDGILFGALLLDFGALACLLWQVSAAALAPMALVGSVFSVGIVLSAYGLNVGHELGHRGGRVARFGSQVLMGSCLYGHFWVEHNLGHHTRAATPEDPASAARGEWVYTFWVRSVVGGVRSAWGLAPRFCAVAWTVQAVALVAVGLTLGPAAAVSWIAAGVVGILLLETVNYLEHYGLRRERMANGRYDRVRPQHSWNSEHPVGRAILFDLPRHADHHAHPRRAGVDLRPFPEAPELPSGYPAMILMSLAPPLFMAVMHPHLDGADAGMPRRMGAPHRGP